MSQNQSSDVSRSADAAVVQQAGTSHGHVAGGRLTLLLSALIGGALTWLLLWSIFPIFAIPAELAAKLAGIMGGTGGNIPAGETMDVDGAFRTVNLKHAIVMTGIFGALLASMLAFGEGLARRSLRTVVFGAVLGIVVGGVLGCLAGLLGFLMDDFLKSVDGFFPVARSVCVQGVVLAVLGAAVGLTFGLLTQRMSAALTCLAYGLLGGGLVAMLFPLGVALAVPNLEPGPAIPNHQIVRLLWIAIVSGVLGLLIPEALRPQTPRRVSHKSAVA